MTGFEKIKSMDVEELAFAIGCPEDFDDNFEVPAGCSIHNPNAEMPISCWRCILYYLNSEVGE